MHSCIICLPKHLPNKFSFSLYPGLGVLACKLFANYVTLPIKPHVFRKIEVLLTLGDSTGESALMEATGYINFSVAIQQRSQLEDGYCTPSQQLPQSPSPPSSVKSQNHTEYGTPP